MAGTNEQGNGTDQLHSPHGFYLDEEQTLFIADNQNHRIVEWKFGATHGRVVAGGNGLGNRADQLNEPTDVTLDREKKFLVICDFKNRRVVRWSRHKSNSGEIIISNIDCYGLTIDDNQYLYVVDIEKDEVKKYRLGDSHGTVVAGGNGKGNV